MATAACNRGQSDSNKSTSASLMEAMATAIAVINTVAATKMADLQYDIAKRYLDMAKWWRDYYNSSYKPLEDVELKEVSALRYLDPKYDIAVGRTRTFARIQYSGVADKAVQCTSAYCTGLRGALLKDTLNAEATATAALSNLGYRNERAYKEAYDNMVWERQLQVLNRGRNMLANNVQFSSLAAGIFGDLGTQAAAGAGGAMQYLGYSRNKNPTEYPMLQRGREIVEKKGEKVYQMDTPMVVPGMGPQVTSGHVYDPVSGQYRTATEEEMSRY